jgi:hypothetical protein
VTVTGTTTGIVARGVRVMAGVVLTGASDVAVTAAGVADEVAAAVGVGAGADVVLAAAAKAASVLCEDADCAPQAVRARMVRAAKAVRLCCIGSPGSAGVEQVTQ